MPSSEEPVRAGASALTASSAIVIGDLVDSGDVWEDEVNVAYAGTSYLALWVDNRDGTQRVRGARVGTDGHVIDASSHLLDPTPSQGPTTGATLASNGNGYLVAWPRSRIEAVRVDASGAIVDTTPLALSAGGNREQAPAVATANGDYLVAWSDERSGSFGLYAARVTGAGAVLDANGFLVALLNGGEPAGGIAAAWTGTAYQLVWTQGPGTAPTLWTARVSAAGVVTQAATQTMTETATSWSASLACSGLGHCFITYERPYSYWGRFLTADGVLGAAVAVVDLDTFPIGLAWDGHAYTAAWATEPNVASDIRAVSFGPGPAPIGSPATLGTKVITGGRIPKIASDGSGRSLVVYMDDKAHRVSGYLLTGDAPDGGTWPDGGLANDGGSSGRDGSTPIGGGDGGAGSGGGSRGGGGSSGGPVNDGGNASASPPVAASGGCSVVKRAASSRAPFALCAIAIAVIARRRSKKIQ